MSDTKSRLITFLHWSEKYTKIDMIYLAQGGFWQTFGQAGSSVLALGLMFIFANFLPKETYGTYRYIISLAGILNIFTLTGMSQAVAQAVANGREGVLRASVHYQLKWNLILMLASWTLGAYYLWHSNLIYGGALLVLSVCIPMTNAFNTYGAYLAAKRKFQLNNIFSILSTLIYVLGMVVAIFVSGEVIWLVAAYAFTTLISNVLFYFVTLKKFSPPIEPSDDVFKYGRHLTYIRFMGPIVAQLDSILLNHFWGPAQLAVYSIAMAIPNRAIPFIKDWVDLGFPKIAVKTRDEINKTFYQRIFLSLLVGAVFAAAYALIAPLLFKYLLPQYIDAVFFTQLLSLNFVFAMPNRYVSTILTAQKMSKRIFINSIVLSITQILLYVILGIWGGILGLIIAQILSSVIGLLINVATWQFRRE